MCNPHPLMHALNRQPAQCHATLAQGHTDYITAVAWSPDGQTLASGSCDDTMRLWDVISGECTAVLQVARRIAYTTAEASLAYTSKTV